MVTGSTLATSRGGGKVHDLQFVAGAEVVEDGVEEEAVKLRLGQRVGAFELDRVLRGQHEKGRGQRIYVASHGAGSFLHGFEQGGLCLWRGAVDLVGKQDVAKDRALDEGPLTMTGGEIFLDDVGAGDVGGHQVRRELDAPERQAKGLRNGAHHQRLGRAGQAGDQAMPADKERDQDLVQNIVLADDHLAHLGQDAVADRVEAVDALLQLGCVLAKFRGRNHRQFPSSRLRGFSKGGPTYVCEIPHLPKEGRYGAPPVGGSTGSPTTNG